jgi:hypothetical protein
MKPKLKELTRKQLIKIQVKRIKAGSMVIPDIDQIKASHKKNK